MKKLLFFLTFLVISIIANAQTLISGRVLEAGSNSPIIGASVTVKGQSKGVLTDSDGNFSLSVPNGKKIIVKYIGMKEQIIVATDNMTVFLSSEASTTNTEEENLTSQVPMEKNDKGIKHIFGAIAQIANAYAQAQSNNVQQNYNNSQDYSNEGNYVQQQSINGYTSVGKYNAVVIDARYGDASSRTTVIDVKTQNGQYYIHVGAQYYLVTKNTLNTYKGFNVSGFTYMSKAGVSMYFF